jgi:hypothetical protein
MACVTLQNDLSLVRKEARMPYLADNKPLHYPGHPASAEGETAGVMSASSGGLTSPALPSSFCGLSANTPFYWNRNGQ